MSFKKFLRRKLLNFFCILLWKQALPSNPSLLWKLWIALHSNSCVATVAVFWESHPEKLKSAVIIKTYIVQDTKMSRIRQNYHEDCEARVNKQINMELYASYVYLSMVSIKLKTVILLLIRRKRKVSFWCPSKIYHYSLFPDLLLHSWWCCSSWFCKIFSEEFRRRTWACSKIHGISGN